MQHFVIDSDFVGNRCTTINHQTIYTFTVLLADSVFYRIFCQLLQNRESSFLLKCSI